MFDITHLTDRNELVLKFKQTTIYFCTILSFYLLNQFNIYRI